MASIWVGITTTITNVLASLSQVMGDMVQYDLVLLALGLIVFSFLVAFVIKVIRMVRG